MTWLLPISTPPPFRGKCQDCASLLFPIGAECSAVVYSRSILHHLACKSSNAAKFAQAICQGCWLRKDGPTLSDLFRVGRRNCKQATVGMWCDEGSPLDPDPVSLSLRCVWAVWWSFLYNFRSCQIYSYLFFSSFSEKKTLTKKVTKDRGVRVRQAGKTCFKVLLDVMQDNFNGPPMIRTPKSFKDYAFDTFTVSERENGANSIQEIYQFSARLVSLLIRFCRAPSKLRVFNAWGVRIFIIWRRKSRFLQGKYLFQHTFTTLNKRTKSFVIQMTFGKTYLHKKTV